MQREKKREKRYTKTCRERENNKINEEKHTQAYHEGLCGGKRK